jgi:alkylation response protein AidB-like acyl-CoA dehydrogenase
MLQVLEELAGHEAAVPWVLWNMSFFQLLSRFLDPAIRKEVFADLSWMYAQSTRFKGLAEPKGDGYCVNGRWDLVSGCDLAEWLLLFCLVTKNGEVQMAGHGPLMRCIIVRKGEYEILDTWHSGGLRGSGSHDVVLKDVFVPASHTLWVSEESTLDEPIGRVAIAPPDIGGFAAMMLGLAQKALDTVVDMARTSVTPGPTPDLRDRAVAQRAVAVRRAGLAGARSHLHESIDAIWQKAVAGDICTSEDRSAAFGAIDCATGLAAETISEMSALGGTRALYTSSPLERIHRDQHAMMRHLAAMPIWAENAGQVMFGMDPEFPLFSV